MSQLSHVDDASKQSKPPNELVIQSAMSRFTLDFAALGRRAYQCLVGSVAYIRALSAFAFGRGANNEQQLSYMAADTIQMLQDGDWAGLRRRFVLPLRLLLTETTLRKGWQMITATTGPIERVGMPVISTTFFTSARIPVHFSRANMAVTLQMLSSGRLFGLRVSPLLAAGLGRNWQHPLYAERGYAREIDIELGSKLEVTGTICLPRHVGSYPCVVFLAGSGPCDRDSSIGALKPLKDLALGLAQRGIASIRFDKATLKHRQKFKNKSSLTVGDEYLDQADAAISHASQHPEIDPARVFLLGHSLGAAVVPYLGQVNDRIRGVILLAAPSEPIYKAYVRQLRYFASLDSEPVEAMQELIHEEERKSDAADRLETNSTTASRELPFGLPASYWHSYRELDPIGTCQRMDKPILLLQGSRDYQVTLEKDFELWKNELGGKGNVDLRVLEGLDHCFVQGDGPSTPADYDVPGNVDVAVINDISGWIISKSHVVGSAT
jgi:pimeloyl-ACP methyl ester carboxylesterase